MEYKFRLLKMHCAGCAVALEQNINTMEGVSAEINFVTKVIKLEISTENPEKTLEEVKNAIKNFDHMIEIADFSEEDEDEEKQERKEKIEDGIRLSVALVIMIANIFVPIFWLKVTIFALDYLLVSYKVLISACINIAHKKLFDESLLMTIASIGAFAIGEYFEAIAVMLLFGIGEMLEDIAVDKSKKIIKDLLEIKQPYANLVDGETDTKVALSDVKIGDIIRIKPGERIPLDGEILDGTSYLDMSALTGESKETIVKPGDEVLSGSINGASVLLVKVTKLEADSTVTRIIKMVEEASETKAKSEKFISKFSKIYTPTVIVLALMLMFIPPIFSGYTNFVSFAYRAMCFLVVSCPCALVISVPLSYFAGIGAFARCGIMVKGANYVDALAKVDSVIFDKTGTLTEGNFEITEISAVGTHTKDEILEIAAYAESFSNHRIAKSVVKAYKESENSKEINTAWINDYTEIAGMGVKANIFMQDVLVGNEKLLETSNVNVVELNKAGTILYIAIAGEYAGYIVIEDMLKKDSLQAIRELKALGIKDIAMCTGDAENVATSISERIGLTNHYANLLPEDKVDIVTTKVQEGKTVAFVGDGINDAPSLANSNVGIAMGGLGSDVAVQASDVVLMTDEPSKVAFAVKKAKKIRKLVFENIIGSLAVKVAVLGLVSFGLAGMWLAVFADVGVTLLAILNSLRSLLFLPKSFTNRK